MGDINSPYYSSDEEIAWGPLTLREIKAFVHKPQRGYLSRRHSVTCNFPVKPLESAPAMMSKEVAIITEDAKNLNISETSTEYLTANESLRTDKEPNSGFLEMLTQVINTPSVEDNKKDCSEYFYTIPDANRQKNFNIENITYNLVENTVASDADCSCAPENVYVNVLGKLEENPETNESIQGTSRENTIILSSDEDAPGQCVAIKQENDRSRTNLYEICDYIIISDEEDADIEDISSDSSLNEEKSMSSDYDNVEFGKGEINNEITRQKSKTMNHSLKKSVSPANSSEDEYDLLDYDCNIEHYGNKTGKSDVKISENSDRSRDSSPIVVPEINIAQFDEDYSDLDLNDEKYESKIEGIINNKLNKIQGLQNYDNYSSAFSDGHNVLDNDGHCEVKISETNEEIDNISGKLHTTEQLTNSDSSVSYSTHLPEAIVAESDDDNNSSDYKFNDTLEEVERFLADGQKNAIPVTTEIQTEVLPQAELLVKTKNIKYLSSDHINDCFVTPSKTPTQCLLKKSYSDRKMKPPNVKNLFPRSCEKETVSKIPVQKPEKFTTPHNLFKMPSKLAKSKLTPNPKSPSINNQLRNNIISPVSIYIHGSTQPCLNQRVQIRNDPKLMPTPTKIEIVKNREIGDTSIQKKIYKPSKKPITSIQKDVILPPSIKKLVKQPEVTKHDRLQYVDMNQTMISRKLQETDLTSASIDISLLSNSDQDISLRTTKQAFIPKKC